MGYRIDSTTVYGAIIRPGKADEVTFDRLQHKLVTSLHFTIGGDAQISSFNGKIAHVGVYIGPGAFRTGLDFGSTFQYGEGIVAVY